MYRFGQFYLHAYVSLECVCVCHRIFVRQNNLSNQSEQNNLYNLPPEGNGDNSAVQFVRSTNLLTF